MGEQIQVDQDNTGRLTWKQICELYRDQWVVLVDTEWVNDTDFQFGSSLLLGHFKSRKEASPFIKNAFQRYSEVGSFWTGKIRGPIPRFIIL